MAWQTSEEFLKTRRIEEERLVALRALSLRVEELRADDLEDEDWWSKARAWLDDLEEGIKGTSLARAHRLLSAEDLFNQVDLKKGYQEHRALLGLPPGMPADHPIEFEEMLCDRFGNPGCFGVT